MSDVDEADRQLQRARDERAVIAEQYERAIGTPDERASYLRLQAVTLRVSICDRLARNAKHLRGARTEAA